MTELKGVLAGAGYFAQFHAEGWNRIPAVKIAAVADPANERALEFARRWGIPRAYTSTEEMLDREQADFIDIITRPDTHLALTRLAATRRIHVICQKPMAPTPGESIEMVQACEGAGVRLIIHENWRWQPWYREVQRLIAQGRLGRVFHVGFHMRTGDGRGPEPYQAQPYFREMPRLLIYETLVHFLDTFRFLAGEIDSLYCSTARINPVILGEDYAVIHLGFAAGARGIIDANRISGPFPSEVAFGELRVEGDRAAVRMSPDGNLWLTVYGQPEAPHAFRKPDTGYKGDSVKAFQEHAAECLRSGRPSESEGRLYLRTVAAMEAAYRSAENGNAESLR